MIATNRLQFIMHQLGEIKEKEMAIYTAIDSSIDIHKCHFSDRVYLTLHNNLYL